MSIDYLIDEIVRAYRVLDPDQAYMQNHCDIQDWLKNKYVDVAQANSLNEINFAMAKERI